MKVLLLLMTISVILGNILHQMKKFIINQEIIGKKVPLCQVRKKCIITLKEVHYSVREVPL